MIDFEQEPKSIATIKVIGIGGAGGNTVNSMIEAGYQGIEFIVANTDAQALEMSKARTKIQMGMKSTKGLGTGTNPEIGKHAALEDIDKIMETLGNSDIVFLAGGMGGGTGSGALPVIARALRERGILTIAVITKPFTFEGKWRANVAEEAIKTIKQEVDTLLIIPNQKLLDVVDKHVSMIQAFAMINDILAQSVRGISDIITRPGHINVDFADVRTIMRDRGLAVMGTGRASGKDRAINAALHAISSPLLENMSIQGAQAVLINISGGVNLGLHEISDAASVVYDQAHEHANIILGSVIDENLSDEVIVTIIATGFTEQTASLQKTVAPHKVSHTIAQPEPSTKVIPPQEQAAFNDHKAADSAIQCASSSTWDEHETDKQLRDKQSAHEETAKESDETYQLEESADAAIDLNDLDIPTFMRNKAEKRI
jgi:cell division protein FtsZ